MIIKNFKKKADYKNVNEIEKNKFEKYLSPIFNLSNRLKGSQTSPKKVGQLTTIFKEYKEQMLGQEEKPSIESWKVWYSNRKVLEDGTKGHEAIKNVIRENLEVMQTIRDFVNDEEKMKEQQKIWIDDLLFDKTFNGLMIEGYVAHAALKEFFGKDDFNESLLIKSSPEQESKNIDFIYEGVPIQVKPQSYESYTHLQAEAREDLVWIIYEKIGQDLDVNIINKKLLVK